MQRETLPFCEEGNDKDDAIPVANNSKQLRPRSRAIFTLDWRRFTVRLWIIPVVRAEAQPPLLHRTLTFIVIQVNTPAPCCGNSQNPSVTEDSFVSSALPATNPFVFIRLPRVFFSHPLPILPPSPLGHSNVFSARRIDLKSKIDRIREDNYFTVWNRIF